VQHLWDCGRAPERPDHPDHALAKVLQAGLLATLPALEPALLARLIGAGLEAAQAGPFTPAVAALLLGTAEMPRPSAAAADLDRLIGTDALRAALGRIACAYDGGHIMD
jgi:hypothetical protein